MTRIVQFKRGTTAQNAVYGGLLGELTVDTDKFTLVLHDGAGGLTTMVGESSTQTVTNKTLTIADNTFTGIDGDGLEITSNELGVDNTVIRNAGNQSIAGNKTFTDSVAVNTTSGITTDQSSINLLNSNAETINFGGDATNLQLAASSGTTTINNNLSVAGDFTVIGTFTSAEEETLNIEDKNIVLGNTPTPTDTLASGGGIILKGSTDKTLLWFTSTDAWTFSEDLDLDEFKSYHINNIEVLNQTTLGTGVINSSLEALGTVTTGTWEADTIATEYGGTGQTSYVDGELLIGNSTGNTLSKGTLDAGTGISVTNGGGSIEVTNTDRGSSQFIFKNIGDSELQPQFTAGANASTLSFEGTGAASVTFNPTQNKVIINAEGEEYTAGDGLTLDVENEFFVDSTVVRTSGSQTINGTKTFESTISGSIDGNAATATKLDPGAFINGVFFDGSENISLPTTVLDEDLLAGDGLSSSGPYNGSTERTFINADKGSTQSIFKNVLNSDGVTQFSAGSNSDNIRFAAGGDLVLEFDSNTNEITYSLNVPESEIYTAGDGLDLTANEFTVDNTVVRTTDINQTVDGTKTFLNALELSEQATTLTQAVRADRQITAGTALTGGGRLNGDVTIDLDTSAVVTTTGNQSISGTKTFVNTIIANFADPGIITNTIQSTNSSFDLINENVSTVNFGADVTELNIGAATGQTNFAHNVNLASGKVYEIDDTTVLSGDTLGTGVTGSSLTSVGILTTGTWQASTIQEEYGGTGETSYTDGQILIGNSLTNGLDKATITAGNNIGIENSNGSITINGAEYTAGNGISLAGNEFSVAAGGGLTQNSNGLSANFSEVVATSTELSGGDGISSIGDLSANRTIAVDNTVLRTSGGQTITGTLTVNDNVTAKSNLDVEGNTQIKSLGVGVAASGVEGEIRATDQITAYSASDKRLKTNVKEIENAAESITKLSGITFDWTDEEIQRRGGEDDMFVRRNSVGVIAQEVEEILPEAVAERPDGHKVVRYELLVPLLVQGIKDQQAQIEMLKEKVEDLCRRS